jgi:hypothetical protein
MMKTVTGKTFADEAIDATDTLFSECVFDRCTFTGAATSIFRRCYIESCTFDGQPKMHNCTDYKMEAAS